MQKPYKHCDEGERHNPFEPCHEGGHPLVNPPCVHFSAGVAPKKREFFSPKHALHIWWFSHIWTFSWENCPFSSKWNRLWCLKASFAIKGLIIELRQVISRLAPVQGLHLLLGYHYDYAIHRSPYTSTHVLIENTLVQYKMAKNSCMALCCQNQVSKCLTALTSIMGFIVMSVSLYP